MFKFDFTEGCVSYSYLINGKEFVDIEDNDFLEQCVITLIKRARVGIMLESLLDLLDEEYYTKGNIDVYQFEDNNVWNLIEFMVTQSDTMEYKDYSKNYDALMKYQFTNELTEKLRDYTADIIHKLLFGDNADGGHIQAILIRLVESDIDTVTTNYGRCDDCGDSIYNYKLEID